MVIVEEGCTLTCQLLWSEPSFFQGAGHKLWLNPISSSITYICSGTVPSVLGSGCFEAKVVKRRCWV